MWNSLSVDCCLFYSPSKMSSLWPFEGNLHLFQKQALNIQNVLRAPKGLSSAYILWIFSP